MTNSYRIGRGLIICLELGESSINLPGYRFGVEFVKIVPRCSREELGPTDAEITRSRRRTVEGVIWHGDGCLHLFSITGYNQPG